MQKKIKKKEIKNKNKHKNKKKKKKSIAALNKFRIAKNFTV